jgi:hypothetical protein
LNIDTWYSWESGSRRLLAGSRPTKAEAEGIAQANVIVDLRRLPLLVW